MRKIIHVILLTCSICCIALQTSAQDPLYSVYWNDNAYLNPARVGERQDAIYSFMHSRLQWGKIISRFHTFSGGVDIGLPMSTNGFGFRVLANVEGEGYQKSIESAFSYAKRLSMPNELYQVSLGLSGGFVSKTIDPTKLVFTDQLDPVYGVIYPTSAPTGSIDNASNLNFSAGVCFLKWDKRGSKCEKEPQFNIGIAAHNITQPTLSMVEGEAQLPMRLTGYLEWNIMNDDYIGGPGSYGGGGICFNPSFLISTQRGGAGEQSGSLMEMFRTFRVGTALKFRGIGGGASGAVYYKSESIAKIYNEESLIFIVGLELMPKNSKNVSQSTNLFFAYDLTISNLRLKTGGVVEVGISIKTCNVEKTKKKLKRIWKNICPKPSF